MRLFRNRKQKEVQDTDQPGGQENQLRELDQKIMVNLEWLAESVDYLLQQGMPDYLVPELLRAIAHDSQQRKETGNLGPAIDQWRMEIIKDHGKRLTDWGREVHEVYALITEELKNFYDGPTPEPADWEERLRAAINGDAQQSE